MKDFRVIPDSQDLLTKKTSIMLQILTVLLIQILFETVFSAKMLFVNTLEHTMTSLLLVIYSIVIYIHIHSEHFLLVIVNTLGLLFLFLSICYWPTRTLYRFIHSKCLQSSVQYRASTPKSREESCLQISQGGFTMPDEKKL